MFGINDGPFHAAEEKMHKEMMAQKGTTVDETWARKMIVHHQGAIDMSEILLEQGSDPAIRQMASESIEKQRRDISKLQQLIPQDQVA